MATATKLRLLVVNGDTALRQGLAQALGQHPAIQVVGWAISGRTAMLKLASYQPDMVLLDLDQHPAEALELLAHLRSNALPVQRLLLASEAVPADTLHQAAQLGALDLVARPAGSLGETAIVKVAHDVLPPILRHAQRLGERAGGGPTAAPAPVARPVPPAAQPAAPAVMPRLPGATRSTAIVGIGVSTGGPKALTQMLPMLPADFPLPIVLVQHMPPKFTLSLAESLDKICRLRVREAQEGDRVERGRILIAPGGQHMRIVASDLGGVVHLTNDPPECSCRPSVDYLFRSLIEVYGGRVLAAVLTGMGEDGWIGARLVHQAGGKVLAQDEASSTVYGMPRGPIEAGIAPAVPLELMADAIVQCLRGVSCN
jgi:two-component system, chemotaxis family, protein-glutamate methylesterase/glutaminase